MRATKLWLVTPKQNISEGSGLWIVAQTMFSAVKKAERWLKKNGYSRGIDKIESHGAIDVF